MATRFYLSSNQAAVVSVTPDAAWEVTTSPAISRRIMLMKKTAEPMTTLAAATSAAGQDRLHYQGVSDPLPAGVVFNTGVTYKCYVLAIESNADDNLRSRLGVRIVSEDGTTVRHTVLAVADYSTATEWNTALRNKVFANGDAGTGSYTTVAGDRLVIEIGHNDATGVSPSGQTRYGSTLSGVDLGENETDTTTTLVPWFETSATFTPRIEENFEIAPDNTAISIANASITTFALAGVSDSDVTAPEGTYSLNWIAAAQSRNIQFDFTPTNDTDWYGRLYFRMSGYPAANTAIIDLWNAGASARSGDIQISPTGQLRLRNQALTLIDTAAAVLAINTWYRIEWHQTTTRFEARIFSGANLHGTTADEDEATLGGTVAHSGSAQVRLGVIASSTWTIWMDAVAIDSSGWIGPAVVGAVPVTASDAGVASETASVTAVGTPSVVEAGDAVEAAITSATLAATESGTAVDTASVDTGEGPGEIVVTHMDDGVTNPPGTSPTTASIAFQNNRLYLLTVEMRGGTTPDVTAVSGGGITWAKTTTTKATTPFMAQYRGLATSGATTGALTMTTSGSPTMFKFTVDEFAGVDTAAPIVQTAAWAGGSNSDGSVSLSTFGDAANNVAYAVFATAQTESFMNVDPSGGWTSLFTDFTGTPTSSMIAQYKTGQDTTVTCDFSSSAANLWAGNALEIKVGIGVGPTEVNASDSGTAVELVAGRGIRVTDTAVAQAEHSIGLGLYSLYNAARFETAVEAYGNPVIWHRIYYQNQLWSGMGQVATDAAAGYKVYVSFRPDGTTWEQIAAGAEDARWTGIGNGLATVPNAGAWCFNHEPENDRLNYGSDANGDAFVAAWERIASIIKPLAPNWQASINLFDEVFPSWEFSRSGNWEQSPDAHRWLSPEMDLLGVDYYAYRGGSDTAGQHYASNDYVYDHAGAFTDFLAFADEYGVPLCVPEFGYVIKDPTGPDPNDKLEQQAWLEDFAATWAGNPKIVSIMYFEVNEQDNSGKGNYAITDDDHPPTWAPTVAAFASIGDSVGGDGEVATVTASRTVSDSGTAFDLVANRVIAVGDSATSADASAVTVVLARTDSALGIDTSSVFAGAAVSGSDSAVGSDSSSMVAAAAATDSGVGADTAVLAAVLATRTDSATASDVSLVGAVLLATDVATAGDTSSLITADLKVGSDAATSADVAALAAVLATRTDAGVGADASLLAAALAVVTDSAVGADISAVTVPIAVTDAAVGADTSVLTVLLTRPDAATAADVSILASALTASDAATGTDTAVLTQLEFAFQAAAFQDDPLAFQMEYTEPSVPKAGGDSGTGVDTSAVVAALNATDVVVGADASASIAVLVAIDAGSSSDLAALAVSVVAVDAGTGADASSVVQGAALSVTDVASGAEASALTAVLVRTDAGAVVDASALAAALVVTDSGVGTDVASVVTTEARSVTDTATSAEVSAVVVSMAATDAGVAVDASTLTAPFAVSDSGASADASSLAAALIRTDSGVGVDTSSGIGIVRIDSGVVAESSVLAVALAVTDAAVTSDTSQLAAGSMKFANDAAIGADTVSGGARAVSDGATSADLAIKGLAVVDAATALDTSSLAVAPVASDLGSSADASALAADLIRTESATATDTSSLIAGAQKSGSDVGTGSDVVTGRAMALTELGTAADSIAGTARTVTDTASVLETSSLGAGAMKVGSDVGLGSDASSLAATLAVRTDSAIGAEVPSVAAAFGVVDAAAGTEAAFTAATLARSDAAVGLDQAVVSTFLQIVASDFGFGSEAATVFVGLGEIVQLMARYDPTLVLSGRTDTALVLSARYDPTLGLRGRDAALALRARFQPEAELVGERA